MDFTPVLILIVIFIICREIMTWYWKINQMVSLLKEIQKELKLLNSKTAI